MLMKTHRETHDDRLFTTRDGQPFKNVRYVARLSIGLPPGPGRPRRMTHRQARPLPYRSEDAWNELVSRCAAAG